MSEEEERGGEGRTTCRTRDYINLCYSIFTVLHVHVRCILYAQLEHFYLTAALRERGERGGLEYEITYILHSCTRVYCMHS